PSRSPSTTLFRSPPPPVVDLVGFTVHGPRHLHRGDGGRCPRGPARRLRHHRTRGPHHQGRRVVPHPAQAPGDRVPGPAGLGGTRTHRDPQRRQGWGGYHHLRGTPGHGRKRQGTRGVPGRPRPADR